MPARSRSPGAVHAQLSATVLGGLGGLLAQGSWAALLSVLAAATFAWAGIGPSQRRSRAAAIGMIWGGGALVYWVTRLLFLRPASAAQIEVGLALVEAALAIALAAGLTPVVALWRSTAVHRYPERLERVQLASLLLLSVLLMAGCARLWSAISAPFLDLPLAILVWAVFGLAASSGVGGAVAIAVALALPLAGVEGNWAVVVYAAAIGLLSGAMPWSGKVSSLAGGWLGIGLVWAWAAGADAVALGVRSAGGVLPLTAPPAHQLLSLLLGSALFLFTPRGWLTWLHRLLSTSAEPDWNRPALAHLRRQIATRLGGVSGVLGQVAAAFDRLPVAAVTSYGSPRYPDLELSPTDAFLADIRHHPCRGCPLERRCWQQSFPSTYWALMELLAREPRSTSAASPPVSSADELPAPLRARCVRPYALLTSVARAREMARVEAAWQQRVMESRQLVAGELRGLSQLMEVLARDMMLDVRLDVGLSTRLEAEWAARRYPPAHITVLESGDGQREIDVEMDVSAGDEPATWGERLARAIGDVLQAAQTVRWQAQATGSEHAVHGDGATQHLSFRVEPAPLWQLDVGISSRTKPGAVISGDSVLRFSLGPGRECLILSDGMGAGWPAADESQAAVVMLRRLLEAGFRTDFAVRTVNAALLLRSSDQEKFATLDLLTVDLQAGQAELIKIGSPPSLLYGAGPGSGPQLISTSSLPAGILATIPIDPQFIELRPDETLVLVTDGVAASIDPHGQPWATLGRTLSAGPPTTDVGQAARAILQAALAAQGGNGESPADDATVVSVRLVPARAKVASDPASSSVKLPEYLRLAGSLLPMLDENPT